jgi:hypothetical protein
MQRPFYVGQRMTFFIYLARAFYLLRYCFSSSYRAQANERWKKAPSSQVFWEVGSGILGLVFLVRYAF